MKFLAEKGINFLTIRNNYRITYPNKVIPQFLMITFIIFSIISCVLGCNIGSTATATIDTCSNINSTHQSCNMIFSTTMSIDRVMNVACSSINDADTGEYIGQLRIAYLRAESEIHHMLEYISSEWDSTQESNYRCPHARGSYCDTQHCNNVTRNAFGNLDNFYLNYTYGETVCQFVPNDGGCVQLNNACLYSGWGIIPNPNTIEGIYTYSSSSPVSVNLFVEFESLNYLYQNFIDLTQAGGITMDTITGFPGTLQVYLDQSPTFIVSDRVKRISYPSLILKDGINPMGTYSPNLVGDIQTNNAQVLSDINYYKNIVTTKPSVLQSQQNINNGVVYNFYKSGLEHQIGLSNNKLPFTEDGIHYSNLESGSTYYSSFRGIKANLTNPGPVQVTILTEATITRQISPCDFDFNLISFQGCCQCEDPAYFEYNMQYTANPCLVNFFSEDVDLITVVNNNINRIYFETDDCIQDVTIKAESVGVVKTSTLHISLNDPVILSFSNGITTIVQIETSYDNSSGEDWDMFDNDWLHGKGSWKFYLAVIVFVIVLLLVLYCVYKLIKCIIFKPKMI